ncbi:Aldo-ket-red domain-containing protein [Mycena indigotica]|uniref:Aldo-ket-red domain-containing protein n=1 Tax=Mycena indigotica TaxID=2126181 RepID=A0A8H6VP42_9AGAR|nr:Aldo-ket-red domain-containing protein [Mycena indigotica]KAF7288479.1 Aldo-ket-red domain-containing protein [Mycena indigotica]
MASSRAQPAGTSRYGVFKFFTVYCPPPTALRLPQTPPARSPPAAIDSHSTPLHLPPCPLQSPSSTQKRCPSARLGPSGLRVPLFSLGGWLTLGGSVVGESVKDIMQAAFENGINMFDTAEDYQKAKSGDTLSKNLAGARTDLVISTKIFWSHEPGTGPNDTGLSHKHVIEGTKACLRRLQMDYVDVIFAHRCDTTVPMEEIVRAFNYVIDQGWAFYWGTSEWARTRSRRRIVACTSPETSRRLPAAQMLPPLKPHRARSIGSSASTSLRHLLSSFEIMLRRR